MHAYDNILTTQSCDHTNMSTARMSKDDIETQQQLQLEQEEEAVLAQQVR